MVSPCTCHPGEPKPGALPRVTDERLAELAADRTGWAINNYPTALHPTDELSIIDELRAWRKYKLTDAEKLALAAVRDHWGAPESADTDEVKAERAIAHAALDKLLGRAKTNG